MPKVHKQSIGKAKQRIGKDKGMQGKAPSRKTLARTKAEEERKEGDPRPPCDKCGQRPTRVVLAQLGSGPHLCLTCYRTIKSPDPIVATVARARV
jgi:hypothetical protein